VCGFLGTISKLNFELDTFINANELQTCRGPDETICIKSSDFEFLNNLNFNSAFIFNRLSIIDLSKEASQPMVNKKFKTLVMFNGEIFNHRTLRQELINEGVDFYTSHSDTEVVLNGLSHFGIDFINKLIGQFSIFFIDSISKKVFLIRDRLGQKPLFFSLNQNELSFSTNLKSLVKAIKNKEVDIEQLTNYLNLGVVPSPNTIIKNCFKVKPGEIIEIDLNNFNSKKTIYWDPKNYLDERQFNNEEFINLFENAVNIRLEADVPLATFVSGGLDSTAIVKAINKNSPINSFSMNFENEFYNEKKWSSIVSEKYKTIHTEKTLSSNLFDYDLDEIINSLDEPYADISYIPTYLLSKEISKSFKVALSGDGGDELFFGYTRSQKELNKRSNYIFGSLNNFLYNIYPGILGTGTLFSSNFYDIKKSYSAYFLDNKLIKLLNIKDYTNFEKNYFYNHQNKVKEISLLEYKFYLSEMMMLKIDRASMANSLEVRSPFVDHRLVELIMSSENSYLDSRNSKQLIKKYLKEDFSENFLNRPKMGFSFDIENWVFDNLGHINETLLSGNVILGMNKNILNNLSIRKSRINAHRIWKLYLLESYLNSIK